MRDMRTPDGWTVLVDEGRGFGPVTEPVLYGAEYGPEWIRMLLVTPEGERAALEFQSRESFPVLTVATSADIELTSLLAKATKTHSLDWWKRKALFEFKFRVNETFTDAVRRVAPEDAEEFAQGGREALQRILAEPVRRTRKRVTDDRLREIADLWKAAAESGSKTPTKDVWEKVNEGKSGNFLLSKDRVRHLVSEARAKGMLPPAQNGPGADKGQPSDEK